MGKKNHTETRRQLQDFITTKNNAAIIALCDSREIFFNLYSQLDSHDEKDYLFSTVQAILLNSVDVMQDLSFSDLLKAHQTQFYASLNQKHMMDAIDKGETLSLNEEQITALFDVLPIDTSLMSLVMINTQDVMELFESRYDLEQLSEKSIQQALKLAQKYNRNNAALFLGFLAKDENNVSYNAFIHGTNSSILSFLPKTDFTIKSPLDMLDENYAAPMTGELTRGGFVQAGDRRQNIIWFANRFRKLFAQ